MSLFKAEAGLEISELVGVLRPNRVLFKLWLEGLFTGLGILLVVLEAVLDPEPCLERDRSRKADVLVWGITGGVSVLLGDRLEAELEGRFGGFLSSTSISTKTAFRVVGSSLVKVPCLTKREPFEPELDVEMVLGAGLANGARSLDLGVVLGLGGDFCLVNCLN